SVFLVAGQRALGQIAFGVIQVAYTGIPDVFDERGLIHVFQDEGRVVEGEFPEVKAFRLNHWNRMR
ncbi:MAG: hypothetical protein ACI84D_001475, partial [Thalassolituus oleivorans]